MKSLRRLSNGSCIAHSGPWDCTRRQQPFGHLTSLPNDRKYQRSYRELKQRDWEQALRQAIRSDSYADTRWVVMDAGAIEHTKQFHDSGVGLISLDRDDLEIHVWADNVYPVVSTTRRLINKRAIAKLPDTVREEIDEEIGEIIADLEGD